MLLVLGFLLYRTEKASPHGRSTVLSSMLFGSIFFWTFIGSSLVLCTAFLDQYQVNPRVGRLVLGGAILASIIVSSFLTIVARRFAVPRMLGSMIGGSYGQAGISGVFSGLCERMRLRRVELVEAKVGNAFSVSTKGRQLVAVSPLLVQSLNDEEAEAVLAHELSHFKNRDSLAKGLARLAHFAFPFDPGIRLIEAAIHRERELLADKSSVAYTGKPLALASALIKAHSRPAAPIGKIGTGLFVGGTRRRWLSLYPDLPRRIELLLKMAPRPESIQELRVAA